MLCSLNPNQPYEKVSLKLASYKTCITWEILSIHNIVHTLHQGAKRKEEQSKIYIL